MLLVGEQNNISTENPLVKKRREKFRVDSVDFSQIVINIE